MNLGGIILFQDKRIIEYLKNTNRLEEYQELRKKLLDATELVAELDTEDTEQSEIIKEYIATAKGIANDFKNNETIYREAIFQLLDYEKEIELEWAEFLFKGDKKAVYKDIKDIISKIDIVEARKSAEQTAQSFGLQPKSSNFVEVSTRSAITSSVRIHLNYLATIGVGTSEAMLIVAHKYKTNEPLYKDKDKRITSIPLSVPLTDYSEILLPNTQTIHYLSLCNEYARKPDGKRQKEYGEKGLNKLAEQLNKDYRTKAIASAVNIDGENRAGLKIEKSGNTVIVVYTNIERYVNNAIESTKKIFYYLLAKAIRYYDSKTGRLLNHTISFPLQELVDIGMYANTRSARKAVENSLDALDTIQIEVRTQTKGRKRADYKKAYLFTAHSIVKGNVSVNFNNGDILTNWDFLFSQYTILPKYAFELKGNAFNLLSYIYDRARQNAKELAEHGQFRVTYKSIIQNLTLPNPEEIHNINRDIIEPIDKAIAEIEEKAQGKIKFMQAENIVDGKGKLLEQVNTGYIQVQLNEDESQRFENIAHKRQKLQNKAKKTNTEKKKKQ